MTHDTAGAPATRRRFLVSTGAAGLTAGNLLRPDPVQAQSLHPTLFPRLDPRFHVSPDQALAWNGWKAQGGPTYAGGNGWKRYVAFLEERMTEFGAVDLEYVDIPYDHYVVEDWPDRAVHATGAPGAVLGLVTDGTVVPVVAGYGMTSGSTPPEGVTAPMVLLDPGRPPGPGELRGKILVAPTAPYPAPPYSRAFLDNYTMTDHEWRSPGKWHEMFVPVPTEVTTSYHTRFVWAQLNEFARIAIAGGAAGMVVVYDLSPGAALGLTQRSVYTPDGKAGLGASYVNCPTLTLDRVNGAKVVADARVGKTATLNLRARFGRDTGRAIIARLPGRDYGTPADRHVLLATHTDAMSLVEENGGLGMLAIMSAFNQVPRASRPRTLVFYFDCRHFMPGGEADWPQFDYYAINKDRLAPVVATLGMEHMGGRQTVETGNDYAYSAELPENGGVITSLMDVYNNNPWLVRTIAQAATDNNWPRVDVKAGFVAPGVNGGLQGLVKSPMNKGRAYGIPGAGLAGDWPGAWTQSFSQVDTEAGPHGFDPAYFTQQVAGLSQITGEFMMVDPVVIDLGWGRLRSQLATLSPGDVATGAGAGSLMGRFEDTFRQVAAGRREEARAGLSALETEAASSLAPERAHAVQAEVNGLAAKLT